MKATTALVEVFGVKASDAIDLINEGLLSVSDKGGFLGHVNVELKKLVGIGLPPDSAIALIAQATNKGIDVDVLAEPLIALREQTKPAVEALEKAFGRERTEELFQTFSESPITAIREISQGFSELESTSREAGLLLADLFKAAGEDNVAAVLALQDLNTELDQVGNKTSQLGQAERERLEANTELGEVQVQVAALFLSSTSKFQIALTKLKTLLFQSLLGWRLIADVSGAVAKGTVAAFKEAGEGIARWWERLKNGAKIVGLQIQRSLTISKEQRQKLKADIKNGSHA